MKKKVNGRKLQIEENQGLETNFGTCEREHNYRSQRGISV